MSEWPRGGGEMAGRIRDHDWAATPLGPAERWPDRLRLMVEQVLASPLVASVACGPERVLIYNDAAAALYGDRHPGALGRALPDAFPDSYPVVAHFYDRVYAGESVHVPAQALDVSEAGGEVFDAYLTPVRDAGGRVIGAHMVGFEIGGGLRVEAALRESEERFRAFVIASSDVVYRMSPDWSEMRRLVGQGFLADTHDPSGGWLGRYIEPEDQPRVMAAIREAIDGRTMFELEHRVRRVDDTIGWTLSRAVPILDRRGEIAEWLGAASDVTERLRSEEALRASEEQRRIALDGGRIGTWRWDLANRLIWGDARFLALWGFPPSDEPHPLALFTERMSPEGAAEMEVIVTAAIAAGEEFDGPLAVVAGPAAGRWIRWRGRAADADASILSGVTFDITEQKYAEMRLRKSEKRQAFLLKLTDTLRPLTETRDIEKQATRLLGEHLKADRCFLSPVYEDGLGMYVREEYLRSGASSVLGDYTFAQFGDFVGPELHAGRVLAVEDVAALTGLSADERASYAAVEIGAYLLIPLVRDGRLAAFLTINHRTPRAWSDADKAVARQTADRLWSARERGRAEAALRESEERFAQFAASSSDALWIRDAATLAMEYTSPAIQAIYGIAPDGILGDMAHWVALVVPGDRDTAISHIRQAQAGASVTHEFRIRRLSDGDVRWIRNTDFPLHDAHGRVQRIGGIAEDVTEARELRERQGVLVGELQHRTRNLMGLVRAMADKTMARSIDLPDFRERFSDRLGALARVQGLLSRLAEGERITFDDLIRAEMAALNGAAEKVTLEGPEGVALRSSTVQTFALALHELCTNAGKYGAFAQPDGRLHVRWWVERAAQDGHPWLHVHWRESGVTMPAPGASPQGGGSGRELIERALPYQLGARTTYVLEADGVHCIIALPVSERRAVREEADV